MTRETQIADVACIRAWYPNLEVRTATLDRSGQNSDILVINEDLIFRFPRYPDGVMQLRAEAAVLRSIQPYVTLPVPNPIYRHLEMDTPSMAFIGYRRLPGGPLWRETVAALDRATIAVIAAQLAAFLQALRAIPVSAIRHALPVADGRAYWADMYERIRANLIGHMRPDTQVAVTRHFEAFLDDPDNFVWTPVLRHGDCGPSNILFDPATQRVTGIIDFGSAALGDPAVDVAALSSYSADFLAAFHAAYPEMKEMKARIAFYRSTFALQEALFGIEHGDPKAFARGIASYQ